MLTFFFARTQSQDINPSSRQARRLVGGPLLLGTLVFTSRHTIS